MGITCSWRDWKYIFIIWKKKTMKNLIENCLEIAVVETLKWQIYMK